MIELPAGAAALVALVLVAVATWVVGAALLAVADRRPLRTLKP